MPTMILVEDENFERHSLIEHIDWGLIGVQIIGEAVNGEQGLTIAMNLRPDIVLSDVNMPTMDGIEMAKKIRAVMPETRILFLSAYDDFDYAKQAIDLNIEAYVMKPVNESELLRAVKKTADAIIEKKLEKRLLGNIQSSFSGSINLARQALVNRVLIGASVSLEDARNLNLEWILRPGGQFCLLFSFFNKENMETIDEDLETLNHNCIKACMQSINICINAGRLITLCVLKNGNTAAAEKIEEIIRRFYFKKNNKDIRIEKMKAQSNRQTPAELYTSFLQHYMVGYEEKPSINRMHKSKQQIVDEVSSIIDEKYQKPLTLESIAKSIHFTPNYVGTIFKSVKKMSVNRYLMHVRMKNVRLLLSNSDLSINDIAFRCGFGSITYFHTAFKKEHGITPVEYRQKNIRGLLL